MGRRIGRWGLVNYRTHPTKDRYKVFGFNTEAELDMMAAELEKRNIWFERGEEKYKYGMVYLIGVEIRDFKEAQLANFEVSARYRNPMIKNRFLRILLITLTAALVGLGIVGYVKNSQKLNEKTEQLEP